MVAVTLMSALLGTLEPAPSVERLAELLEAANRPLAQLTGVSRSTMRGGLGNGPVEVVLLRMEEDSFGDGSHVVYVNRVLLKERSFTDWTDTVTGRNADYTFKLSREPGETKWQLESVRPTDVGGESTNASGVRYYLFGWVNKRTLPDLLRDGTIEKTVVPLPGGGWLIDGRTGHETGLLSFRTRVKATDKYAYVVWASCRLATRDGGVDEHESEVRVREDVLPIPEWHRYVTRTTNVGVPETRVMETEHNNQLVLSDTDRAKFRLSHYGLPEPDLSPPTPFSPVPVPPATRSTYTWMLLLPVAGVVLLVVANVLLKKKRKPSTEPDTSVGDSS